MTLGLPEFTIAAVFLAGLGGGVHCAAMCGPLVGIACGPRAHGLTRAQWLCQALAYNAGRIATYVVAGALTGAIGATGLALRGEPLTQQMAAGRDERLADRACRLRRGRCPARARHRNGRGRGLAPHTTLFTLVPAGQHAGTRVRSGPRLGLAALRHGVRRADRGFDHRRSPSRRDGDGGLRPGNAAQSAGHIGLGSSTSQILPGAGSCARWSPRRSRAWVFSESPGRLNPRRYPATEHGA